MPASIRIVNIAYEYKKQSGYNDTYRLGFFKPHANSLHIHIFIVVKLKLLQLKLTKRFRTIIFSTSAIAY